MQFSDDSSSTSSKSSIIVSSSSSSSSSSSDGGDVSSGGGGGSSEGAGGVLDSQCAKRNKRGVLGMMKVLASDPVGKRVLVHMAEEREHGRMGGKEAEDAIVT
jgi:hypothetical protein